MKKFTLSAAAVVVLIAACSKSDGIPDSRAEVSTQQTGGPEQPEAPEQPGEAGLQYPHYEGHNSLIGKWLIGKFERHCGDYVQSFENNNGNYIEFTANDSVYTTYVTDESFGFGTYQLIDSNIVLFNGIVHEIISKDDRSFTLYYEMQDGKIKQWSSFHAFDDK